MVADANSLPLTLVIHSQDLMPRNGDCYFPFRQDSDFFYLTGIDQEESVLLMIPGAINAIDKEVLFIKETNEHIGIWEGHKYSKEQAFVVSGIKNVQWLSDMKPYLDELLNTNTVVFYNQNENERAVSSVKSRNGVFG